MLAEIQTIAPVINPNYATHNFNKLGHVKKLMKAVPVLIGLLVISTAFALPNPGILPDSPFYGLKKLFEKLDLAFTFSDEAKAEKYLHYAEVRLAEAKAMLEKNKTDIAQKVVKEYSAYINKSEEYGAKVNKTEVMEHIINATEHHLEVLQEVYDKVPEQAKPAIEHAIAVAELREEKLLEALENLNGTLTLGLRLRIANESLNRMKACLEANNTKCIETYMHHYQHHFNKTEELARKLNTTEVYELVANATLKHIEVLEEVKERVHEEAREAIEKAIEVSQKGHEEAQEAIKKKSGMKEKVEEIEEEVKESKEMVNQTINQIVNQTVHIP